MKVKLGASFVAGAPDGKPLPLPPPPARGSFFVHAPFVPGVPSEAGVPAEEAATDPYEGLPPPMSGPGRDPGPFPRRGKRSALAAETETPVNEAIDRGLRWLAAHQSLDGGWEAAGFPTWCDGKTVDAPVLDGKGSAHHDVGATGLALLAFLGAGHTNRSEGPYGKVLGKGLKYLRNVQDPEGCFGRRQNAHYIYDHGIAALAMVEAYAMTGSALYRPSAQKALDFTAIARNPYFAWRYGVKPGDNDTSVTAWMFQVLDAARRVNAARVAAGWPPPLEVDDDAFGGVKAWLDKMTDPDTGRVGYQQRGSGPARPTELVDGFPADRVEGLTGFGVFARIALGEDPATSEIVRKGVRLVAALPPAWETNGSIDYYSWHLCAIAMAQLGGEAGTAWRKAARHGPPPAPAHRRRGVRRTRFLGSDRPLGPRGWPRVLDLDGAPRPAGAVLLGAAHAEAEVIATPETPFMRALRTVILGATLLLAAPSYAGDDDAEAIRTRLRAAIPTSALPVTGTVGEIPAGALEIGIAADGTYLCDGKECGLEELEASLRRHAGEAKRSEDGESTARPRPARGPGRAVAAGAPGACRSAPIPA